MLAKGKFPVLYAKTTAMTAERRKHSVRYPKNPWVTLPAAAMTGSVKIIISREIKMDIYRYHAERTR